MNSEPRNKQESLRPEESPQTPRVEALEERLAPGGISLGLCLDVSVSIGLGGSRGGGGGCGKPC